MPLLAAYHLEKAQNSAQGLARVWAAGLFINDETTSRVMFLADPYHGNADRVREVWLARSELSGRDVGMIMLSDPTEDSDGRAVLNLYVHADHQGQGLGSALLQVVLENHVSSTLAAYYTLDAVRIYHRAGLTPAEIIRTDPIQAMLDAGDVDGARRQHIANCLAERASYDRMVRGYRQKVFFT